jgi:RNA polymerase sigma-32 factor
MNQALALSLPLNASTGSLDDYLAAVGKLPRLEVEEEHALAIRFRENDDLEAARLLVMSNLRFVAHVARGYMGYGLPLPDLIQEGNIGLMKAVKRFDPEMGVRLVSFAVHWIKAEIHEYIIQNWRIVKVATTKAQRKLFFNLRKHKTHLGWLSAEEASSVAEELGVDVETVYEMESRLSGQDIAFDAPDETEDGERETASPVHYLSQAHADPADLLEEDDWGDYKQQNLVRAIAELDDRSQDILKSRWLSEEKLTLHDLAARYNVSAERIRQLENTAMKRIRRAMEE